MLSLKLLLIGDPFSDLAKGSRKQAPASVEWKDEALAGSRG